MRGDQIEREEGGGRGCWVLELEEGGENNECLFDRFVCWLLAGMFPHLPQEVEMQPERMPPLHLHNLPLEDSMNIQSQVVCLSGFCT